MWVIKNLLLITKSEFVNNFYNIFSELIGQQ